MDALTIDQDQVTGAGSSTRVEVRAQLDIAVGPEDHQPAVAARNYLARSGCSTGQPTPSSCQPWAEMSTRSIRLIA
jgi:hypothetical protein